jgi:hypothetical protein
MCSYDFWRNLSVESKTGAVALDTGGRCFRPLSRRCRCLRPYHSSVSCLRSSNRTCSFPTSGPQTGFRSGYTEKTLLRLDIKLPLHPPDLLGSLQAHTNLLVLGSLGKHPELRPLPSSAGITRLPRDYGPLGLPTRPLPLTQSGLPRCAIGLARVLLPLPRWTAMGV